MKCWNILFLPSLLLLGDLKTCVSTSSNPTGGGRPNDTKSALQRDFVRAMDRATGRNDTNQEESILSKLASLALPASHHPEYMAQHRQQFRQGQRNLENAYQYQDQSYAIDMADYALKYIGCSNIKTWSDDLAADENSASVLRTDRFVVLRLCPKDSCSNYNQYGCLEKFGDYLIPMEAYLQAMYELFFTQYQEYCETCYACMKAIDGANGKNGNNRARELYDDANNGDDAVAGDGDDYLNYYNNANNGGGCQYYAVCENYKSACSSYGDSGFDLQNYYQCTEFNIGDNVGYLGPHCKGDGKTIGFGIYHDQYCNQYNADLLEMSSFMSVSDNDLAAYSSSNCISCLASDGYTLNVNDNAAGYSDVADICEEIYDQSAKCHKYMGNRGDYESSNQEAQEGTVCNFIKNLITHSYDEYGEIYLESDGWASYIPDVNTMPRWQKYALSVSALMTVGLWAYAWYLRREITQRKFVWYPRGRRGYSTNGAGGLTDHTGLNDRTNSGIIQGRSQGSFDFETRHGGTLI